MLKIIKNSTLVPTPIVDLKLDSEPRQGSTDPVTSEGVKSAIDGAVGDAAEALQQQIDEIAEKAGSGYTPKGEASVATLNGLSGQENGELYTMTDAGTLTDGSLAVVAGDTVAWDATNEVWYKAMDYAPRQYGTNEVHNLPTTITAFRTGDVIAVDGPSGTAKMPYENLLKVTTKKVLDEPYNLFNPNSPEIITGGFWSDVNTWNANANFCESGLMPCRANDVLYRYTPATDTNTWIASTPYILYDENKDQIAKIELVTASTTLTIPNNPSVRYISVPLSYPIPEKYTVISLLPVDRFIAYYDNIPSELDEINKNAESLDSFTRSKNLFNPNSTEILTGGFWSDVNTWVSNANFSQSAPIACRPNEVFYRYTPSTDNKNWPKDTPFILYDKDKNQIAKFQLSIASTTLKIPSNSSARYFSLPLSYPYPKKYTVVARGPVESFFEYYPNVNEIANAAFGGIPDDKLKNDFGYGENDVLNQKFVTQQFGEGNMLNPGAMTISKIINTDGTIVINNDYAESDFIPCEYGDKIYRYRESGNSTTWGDSLALVFYDENKQYVTGLLSAGQTALPIPNNPSIKYFRYPVSIALGDIHECVSKYVQGTFVPYKAKSLDGSQWMGKRWFAYGTSITDTTPTGKYLPILAKMSGMVAIDKGIGGGGIGNLGGFSTGQVYDAICNTTDGKLDADLITLETGANDTGASVPLGTIYDDTQATLAGCLNICLRYLQTNTHAQIAVMPSPSTTTKPAESNKYYEWQRMIRDICFINRVFFIEPADNLGYAKLTSASGSDYVVDNIHQTELGGYILAEAMWEKIKCIPNFRTTIPV